MHLFVELQPKGKNSIFQDYFCVNFDELQVLPNVEMFFHTVNVRIENQDSQ